jgi:trans-2,3-dihydro-3-hydroxyanthranilate isomerase
MGKYDFCIVDVFAENKFAGNQLTVFKDAADFTEKEMQQIAKEISFSETTFIRSGKQNNGGFDVRIFTPEREIAFAGHPTLGSAYVIEQDILKKPPDEIMLNLKVGQIAVTFDRKKGGAETLWMKQIPPAFGKTINAERMAKALSLRKSDIDQKYPTIEVSTGTPFFIVPLKSQDALKKAEVSRKEYFDLIKNRQAKATLIFSPETYYAKNDLSVRVFAHYYGVPEDPATGSANGCLAGYLARYKYFDKNSISIRVEQGYEIGRPSLLRLKAKDKGEQIDVFVGGRAIMVARGKLV